MINLEKSNLSEINFDFILQSELNIDILRQISICKIKKDNEPKIFNLIIKIFNIFSNKKKKNLYQTSYDACLNLFNNLNPWIIPDVLLQIINCMKKSTRDDSKINGLKLICYLSENYKEQIKLCLIDIMTPICELLYNPKKSVSKLAEETLIKITKCNGNKDLDPFLPIVIDSLINVDKMTNAVESLAGCVFVQNIECSALAVTLPILSRGLNNDNTETKRKCCVIIDNMCKLVEHPKEIIPILDELKPRVINCANHISNPEARSIAEKALNTINKASNHDNNLIIKRNIVDINQMISKEMNKNSVLISYVSQIITNLCNSDNYNLELWKNIFYKYLNDSDSAEKLMNSLKSESEIKEDKFEDTEEGADLYQGEFSLAYGALTLLNNTHIHLKKNRFYGLLGPNNCGKTTLMRAISREQVEGFPKKDELKTIFVEHEIQEREVGEDDKGYPIFNIDLSGIEWVVDCCNNIYQMQPPVNKEQVEEVMAEIGFGNSNKGLGQDRAADAAMGVTTYSGGWKMKMQLCAATLMDADILMLDEPTGHLDVDNITWLKSWLTNFKEKGGSIITTSHDSAFLDAMCTHIIDFENRKLRMFKGDKGKVLKQFVEKHPEKQGYFELKNDIMKFEFPTPLPLGKGSKCILKMTNVSYKYPIRDNYTVMDISLNCSTSSRVAVIGPNGAGKSTAIKLLIGELKPSKGVIWKNPNSRVAYVAQHAFQHLEKHITKTPTEYILWRFAGNDDKESLEFKSEESDEERPKRKYFLKPIDLGYEIKLCTNPEEEKKSVFPDYLLDRRILKKEKTKEYEVKWVNKPREQTTWVKREILISMGAIQKVQKYDEKKAAEEGLMTKSLTSKHIEKHLLGFGIEPEQASHTLIGSLSGGQKVKVVLAASMWLNPHLVILDEPTNYLDRDGLGALTKAIEEFKGGVVIISHNREFANAVSQEKWIMEKGRLRREGESLANLEEEDSNKPIQSDTFIDANGNELKINTNKTMSEKEKKNKIKKLTKRLKKDKTLTQEERWEIEDEIEELSN